MPDDYDRRTGAVNRLVPLAELAANDFKAGLRSIEQAYNTLKLIEKEARAQIPRDERYPPAHGRPKDKFYQVADYAYELRKMLDEKKPFDLKSLDTFFDEFVSETKAHMADDK